LPDTKEHWQNDDDKAGKVGKMAKRGWEMRASFARALLECVCVCECPGCALKYACRKLKLIIYIFKAHQRAKGECRQDVDAGK